VVLRGHRETTQYVHRCLRHSHWMRSDDDHHVIISRGSVSLCSLSRVTRVQVLTEGGSHCHSTRTSTFEARAYLLMFVYSDRLELFFFFFFAKRASFKSLSLATHVISSHNCTPTKEVSTPPLRSTRQPSHTSCPFPDRPGHPSSAVHHHVHACMRLHRASAPTHHCSICRSAPIKTFSTVRAAWRTPSSRVSWVSLYAHAVGSAEDLSGHRMHACMHACMLLQSLVHRLCT
jgi:hypothetical protein